MSHGRSTSRFEDVKRTYPKPINISTQVLLDRERCVLCARCTRFSEQIAGDPFIALVERGALQQVGIYEDQPFESYFSGNTVQICPVGALTGAAYRFRSRPFDLVSTPSVCEHCASGCAMRTDHRRGTVLRRMAQNDPAVNEEWNCDKGRWAFAYTSVGDRLELPMVRDDDGELRVASWRRGPRGRRRRPARRDRPPACSSAAGSAPKTPTPTPSSRAPCSAPTTSTSGPGRTPPRRPTSSPPPSWPPAPTVARSPTPTSSRPAPCCSSASSPRTSRPIVFLRLRKAFRKHRTAVYAVAPVATRGLAKVGGTLIPTAPGTEPEVLGALAEGSGTDVVAAAGQGLRDNAVVLVGERLATVPGALTAVVALAEATGARLAWVPRRAGERGALEAGALPTLLPGGRPLADAAARAEVASAWGVASLADTAGRDTAGIVAAAASGELDALVVGGVDPLDLAGRGCRRRLHPPVRRLARDPPVGGHRGGRRRAAGRGARREGRHLRRLGGPGPQLRGGHRLHRRSATTGRSTCSPTRWVSSSAPARCARCAPRWRRWARGRVRAQRPRPSRPATCRVSRRAPWCSPPGATCSTMARCRTASRSSRAPRPARSPGCRPPRHPTWVSSKATR